MADKIQYAVRPFSRSPRTDRKDFFRIYLSQTNLVLHDLKGGEICRIHTQGDLRGHAIAWKAPENIQDSVVQIPNTLQTLYRLSTKDKVSLTHSTLPIPDADTVTMCEISSSGPKPSVPNIDPSHKIHWAWHLKGILENAEYLLPGMILDRMEAGGQQRTFQILEINLSRDVTLHHAPSNCRVNIVDNALPNDKPEDWASNMALLDTNGMGGLSQQVAQINKVIVEYIEPDDELKPSGPGFWPGLREGGILLYGLAGTGKSIMLRRIADAGWKGVFQINGNGKPSEIGDIIRKAFSDARKFQPSTIVIDNLEHLAARSDGQDAGRPINTTQTLCEEMDRLGGARTLVVGATPSLAKIDQALRKPKRFTVEIEAPVPDLKSRLEILKVLRGLPKDTEDTSMEQLANKTHGFVGSDLANLLSFAAREARTRARASRAITGENVAQGESCSSFKVTDSDLSAALREVRPTAMRELFVETPRVRWSDIGGQENVKKNLEKVVIWPSRDPRKMAKLGIEPRRGLLLYGPPGCSKTMTAKALATESGHNFITVKGAELLNMYVGESERAVRELFSKARAVSPSIIFFDEIDAIGGVRDGGLHGGVHIGTTLLNELDGIQELKGVFVLAATNRPELIDPALTRAGRLDTMLYVGPPDREAREYILRKRLHHVYIADDVDISDLARKTEGYSGAELVSICHLAGEAAFEDGLNAFEQVSQRHVSQALEEAQKSITPEMIASYEKFATTRC